MLDPWLPLPISLVALILTHLLVTRALITLAFRLFHSLPVALLSYAMIIWPGTVVHEWAHWLAARLLGLRASLPNLLPQLSDKRGQVVLGHVMVERGDPIRRTIVGGAPFLAGTALIALLASQTFAIPVPALAEGGLAALEPLVRALPRLFEVPNAWLWLYLLLALANGMLPSPSDRETWPAVLAVCAAILLVLALTVGLPTPSEAFIAGALRVASWLTLAFALAALLNLLLAIPLLLAERLLWMMGR